LKVGDQLYKNQWSIKKLHWLQFHFMVFTVSVMCFSPSTSADDSALLPGHANEDETIIDR